MRTRLGFAAALFWTFLCLPSWSALASMPQAECLQCHSQTVPGHKFAGSVHGQLSCTACHIQVRPVAGGAADPTLITGKSRCLPQKKVDCASCHSEISRQHASSVHNGNRLPIGCTDCHSEIHSAKSLKGDKLAIANACASCHGREKAFFESDHAKALEKGRMDSATCTDCHGMHAIAKVDNRAAGRAFHTESCMKCHADSAMMERNQVLAIAPNTYFASYHGKNVKLGYPEKVAGCADCHGSHAVLKAESPKSSVHRNNITQTCAQCHGSATPSFAQYYPHADHHDRGKYPVLYWAYVLMTALLVATFVFFWLHSVLWGLRSFVDKREKERLEAFPEASGPRPKSISDGKALYRRFKPIHIGLHLLVIVSFLGLSLTGLPLRFNSTPWGKVLMDLLGGPVRAGLIHRICAVITFFYFSVALVMSARFLFDKKRRGTFTERLFGPDSLFFSARDLKDFGSMVKWFLFRGPKPTFERWTYWEKFDFLAVFWGMLVIGSSGLMLWFPEFFGKVLPGWMFNVATIIHSDEALLATGFIFTVHFFNTHLRAEKFPMDTVIFNGRISKHEMLEERGDQWRRYEAEGRTEEFRVTRPTPLAWEFLFRVIGFAAVLIGLALAFAIVYAIISQGVDA